MRWVFGALLAAATTGCVVNPVTGQRELLLMSESQEAEQGKAADEQIVAQYGLVEDPQLQAYVEEVGTRLVAVSHKPDLAFTFRILDDPIVNAFALPGGYVYLTRGILPYLESEAGMAGVLGHEIGHVTARHGASRATKQILLQGTLGVAGVLSERLASAVGVLGAAANLLLLKYSRDDERQSDQLGVEYATAAGYDTRDMARFFAVLSALSPEGGGIPSWVSTHPDPGERDQTVQRLTAEAQQARGTGPYAARRDEFLARVDGLVFGQDPQQGYVANGRFLHPQLRLQFPAPNGWSVENGRSQVTLSSPEGDMAVIFAQAEGASPQAAAEAFASTEGIEVQQRGDLTINGFPAHRLVAAARTQQGQLGITSTFLAKDGRVWAFHGISEAAGHAAAQPTLVSVPDGFAALDDPQALAVQPVVVRVVELPQPGTIEQVAQAWPIPPQAGVDVNHLALLNGVSPGTQLEAGRKVKVLVQGKGSGKK